MKFNYEGNSKSSGIYKIFNTHTNRVYIGQIKHSAERTDKNRASHLGQEAWNKCLECPQIAGENHPFYGKIHSEETKQKISDSCKGRIPWNKGRKRSA